MLAPLHVLGCAGVEGGRAGRGLGGCWRPELAGGTHMGRERGRLPPHVGPTAARSAAHHPRRALPIIQAVLAMRLRQARGPLARAMCQQAGHTWPAAPIPGAPRCPDPFSAAARVRAVRLARAGQLALVRSPPSGRARGVTRPPRLLQAPPARAPHPRVMPRPPATCPPAGRANPCSMGAPGQGACTSMHARLARAPTPPPSPTPQA